MGWRDYAKQVQRAGTIGTIGHNSPETPPIVPIVPGVLPLNPARALKGWRKAIGALDPCQPPDGFTMDRWQTLFDCSESFLEHFGEGAARNGYSTADIFGLLPDKPRWGGLVDRMVDCRSLVMSADSARWRSFGVPQKFQRGTGDALKMSGIVPFWEREMSRE